MKRAIDYPRFCPSCAEARVIDEETSTSPDCVKCGFKWQELTNPQQGYMKRMSDLSNQELLQVIRIVYPILMKFPTEVATRIGVHQSHVSHVLSGNRSARVEGAIVEVFRERLTRLGLKDVA